MQVNDRTTITVTILGVIIASVVAVTMYVVETRAEVNSLKAEVHELKPLVFRTYNGMIRVQTHMGIKVKQEFVNEDE